MLCNRDFNRITPSHLKYSHDITMDNYREMFPNAELWIVSDETRKNMSVAVCEGLAAMSSSARASMYQHIGEGLNNMSDEAKAIRSKAISEGVRRSLAERKFEDLVVPKGFGEWFAGFFEGDGCVECLYTVNNMGSGYVFRPVIEFAQKDADVLEYVASVIPNSYLGWTRRKQGLYRHLKWDAQKRCAPILKLLSGYTVTNNACERLNTALFQLNLPLVVDVCEPSWKWITGFWDAEGSVEDPNDSVTSTTLTFYQKDDSVLFTVRNFLGVGRVHYPPSGPRLTILHDEGRELAVELLKYSCVERKKDMLRRRFGLNDE